MWEYLVEESEIIDPAKFIIFFGNSSLWGGLFIGFIWGFVLQKSTVCKYDVVARLFMLQEFTVFRVGAPLLVTAMLLLALFHDIGVIENLLPPSTKILAQIMGGLFMGIGIAISGYCPGTSAGALGEGAVDAIFFMFGMLFGSFVFAEIYPWVNKTFFTAGDYGNITLDHLLGVNRWLIIIPFAAMIILFDLGITFWDWTLYLFALPVYLFRQSMRTFDEYLCFLGGTLKKEASKPQLFFAKTVAFVKYFFKDPFDAVGLYIRDILDIFEESDGGSTKNQETMTKEKKEIKRMVR